MKQKTDSLLKLATFEEASACMKQCISHQSSMLDCEADVPEDPKMLKPET